MTTLKEKDNQNPNREQHLSYRDFTFSLSNIDVTMIPEGFQYSLQPFRVRDHRLRDEMSRAYRLGWRPVERNDHPEWGMTDELESLVREGEIQYQNTYLVDRDRIMMRMPKYLYQELLDVYNSSAEEQMGSISNNIGGGNDPQGLFMQASARFQRGNTNGKDTSYTGGQPLFTLPKYTRGSVHNSFGS